MTSSPEILNEAGRDRETLVSYAYSYPHKSSYRKLDPSVAISEAWQHEDQSRLALYAHIPFCEMRCGFCNLFTQAQPDSDRVQLYLESLHRQMSVVREQLPQARFVTAAIGGGTPTYLAPAALQELLTAIEETFDFSFRDVPTSVETSPATATRERLEILSQHGIQRISIGIQSFLEHETNAFGRPQQSFQVQSALELIQLFEFPVLNIDLIYGSPMQSRQSWLESLRIALQAHPDELYLYPLYIRPETGLARTGHGPSDHRIDLYRAGRDFLLAAGYEQISLRCFRRPDLQDSTSYTCQRDGMVGLGCGARSYTRQLHYATRFAVTQAGVRAILDDWMNLSDREFARATHGIWLTAEEQCRRFVILSLLQASGLCLADYLAAFGSSPWDDIPGLLTLQALEWLCEDAGKLHLTDAGIENSDVAGPLLYSHDVRQRLREFARI